MGGPWIYKPDPRPYFREQVKFRRRLLEHYVAATGSRAAAARALGINRTHLCRLLRLLPRV